MIREHFLLLRERRQRIRQIAEERLDVAELLLDDAIDLFVRRSGRDGRLDELVKLVLGVPCASRRRCAGGPSRKAAAALSANGFDFADVSGNRRIVVTVVGPRDKEPHAEGSAELFESRVLSDPDLERHVLLVETRTLSQLLRALPDSGARLEHVYDY